MATKAELQAKRDMENREFKEKLQERLNILRASVVIRLDFLREKLDRKPLCNLNSTPQKITDEIAKFLHNTGTGVTVSLQYVHDGYNQLILLVPQTPEIFSGHPFEAGRVREEHVAEKLGKLEKWATVDGVNLLLAEVMGMVRMREHIRDMESRIGSLEEKIKSMERDGGFPSRMMHPLFWMR